MALSGRLPHDRQPAGVLRFTAHGGIHALIDNWAVVS